MGFFSWKTQDTDESIPNRHCNHQTFTVYMYDHLGNVWEEDSYDGYGEFGGKDYYELLAEMNGIEGRQAGIDLAFADPARPCLFPNLARRKDWAYVNSQPESCPEQGYFYYNEDEDDEDYGDCW